jgi:hypothetical protein
VSPWKLRTRSSFPYSSQLEQFVFTSRGQRPIFIVVRNRALLDTTLD